MVLKVSLLTNTSRRKTKQLLKVEEELEFRIIEFNKDQKRIIVSHTDIWKEEERARIDSETDAKHKAAKTND